MAAARDDLNTPLIIVVGVLFVILTFVLVVLLQAYFFKVQAEEHYRKAIAPRSGELDAALAEQAAELAAEYRWLDRQQGIVGIPIERAMELVVREAGAGAAGGGPERR